MRHNVIVFGETGSGKSSIINMILGANVAAVSNSLQGCTFKIDRYETRIANVDYHIYDTVGLNEGNRGRVPHWAAVERLYTLIRQLDSVSLLVYCMRGRIRESSRSNWTFFHKILCREAVPIVAVVTGLDSEENLKDWGKKSGILGIFKQNAMYPKDVLGVVAYRGTQGQKEEAYNWSQKELRNLISQSCRTKPWNSQELAQNFETVFTAKRCFSPRAQLEFIPRFGVLVDDFTKQTSMKPEESKKLKASLFQAEKKFRSIKKKKK